MQKIKALTAATLACSLLSTTAVLALASGNLRISQAEAPAATEDDDNNAVREKNSDSNKGKADRKRDDREQKAGDTPPPSKTKSEEPKEKEKRPKADDEAQIPDRAKKVETKKTDEPPRKAPEASDAKREKPDRDEKQPDGVKKDNAPRARDAGDGSAMSPAAAGSAKESDATRERDAESDAKAVREHDAEQDARVPLDPERTRERKQETRPADTKPDAGTVTPAEEPPAKATTPAPSATEEKAERAPERQRERLKPAESEAKDLKQVNERRKERSEEGGKRIVIEEPDKRAIIKEEGRTIIRHDETERFRRLSRDTRVERRDGLNISVTVLGGGIEIYTELDDEGRSLRRYRRDGSGREIMLFDNSEYYRRHRGGSFLDAIIELPPPRLNIKRTEYIVDYEEASYEDIYEALSAPPVEELTRTYALEEVRRSPRLRDRMRRVDLDTIKFDFGSWEVPADQYRALDRIARAINRVIEKNQNEVFLIEGHTDAVGAEEDNLSLSDRRAEAVAVLLTERFNVPPENMTTQGYGEQNLKIETDQAEQQNRRVAVRRITPLLSRANQ